MIMKVMKMFTVRATFHALHLEQELFSENESRPKQIIWLKCTTNKLQIFNLYEKIIEN